MNDYFERYCDYTGGLGIGFDQSHTYDYRFRQELKRTENPELKRLYVIQHLARDVELALDDFARGIVMTGKTSSRSLTLPEWRETRREIEIKIGDLEAYVANTNFATLTGDPLDPYEPEMEARWIKAFREQLARSTNAPPGD